jgi:hypothetical protein
MGVFCARSADAARDLSRAAAHPTRAYVSLVRIMAAVGFLVAVLILLGWVFDLTILKSGFPGQRARNRWAPSISPCVPSRSV